MLSGVYFSASIRQRLLISFLPLSVVQQRDKRGGIGIYVFVADDRGNAICQVVEFGGVVSESSSWTFQTPAAMLSTATSPTLPGMHRACPDLEHERLIPTVHRAEVTGPRIRCNKSSTRGRSEPFPAIRRRKSGHSS